MCKTYADYMNELSGKKLYKGLLAFGLFSERLPPFLTAQNFYKYCIEMKTPFNKIDHSYIEYENMRNINIFRSLAIPNPMAYQILCNCLRDNWDDIKKFFKEKTINQKHKVSRIHIRKLKDFAGVFLMNYENKSLDISKELDFLVGARYILKVDISNCFPSIYTHALEWALIGRDEAKKFSKKKNVWAGKIDECARKTKENETHGLLIGSHAYNLLSEIILVAIDYELHNKEIQQYVRHIDDYEFYASNYDEAQKILIKVKECLKMFDLKINEKKTEILELPVSGDWTNKLKLICFQNNQKVNLSDATMYFDVAIELWKEHNRDSAILNYAIKVITKKVLTEEAKQYIIKKVLHLAYLFPYLIRILDNSVFKKLKVGKHEIAIFSRLIFDEGIRSANYEEASYAVYFAIKYKFAFTTKENDVINIVENSKDCIFMLLVYLFAKKNRKKDWITDLKKYAKTLCGGKPYDKFWLFLYEVLDRNDLNTILDEKVKSDWVCMKKHKVSFVRNNFI